MGLREFLERKTSRRSAIKGVIGTGVGIVAGKAIADVVPVEAVEEVAPYVAPKIPVYTPWAFCGSTTSFGTWGTAPYYGGSYQASFMSPPNRRLEPTKPRRTKCSQCGGPLTHDFYGDHCEYCGTEGED